MSVIKGNHGGLGGAGAPGGALGSFYSHTIDQSLRMNKADSPRLIDSSVSSDGNRRKFTFSFWIKFSKASDTYDIVIGAGGSGSYPSAIIGFHSQRLTYKDYRHPSYTSNVITTAVFRDVSSWYHFVVAVDTTQSTASDRIKMYVNGTQLTDFDTASYPTQNYDTLFQDATSGNEPLIGFSPGFDYMDGYLADIYNVDNAQLAPTEFGETKDGVWVPKEYSGSFGTTGYHLTFSDSSSIGADSSGNSHSFDTVTNLAASDVVPDSPTNNWCTNNSAMRANITHSEGSLKMVGVGGNFDNTAGTFLFDVEDTDGWYWEGYVNSGGVEVRFGISKPQNIYFNQSDPTYNFAHSSDGIAYKGSGSKSTGGTDSSYGDSFTTGDVIGIAVKAGALYFYKNGSIQNSGTAAATGLTGQYVPAVSINSTLSLSTNYGQDSTFAGAVTAGGNSDANGLGDFKHSVPSGYKALCASNLPDITIGPGQSSQADDYFNTVLYTGDGTTSHAITGVGFQPDWVSIKNRSNARSGINYDVIRGANSDLRWDSTAQEDTSATNQLLSFDADGFTVGDKNNINGNNETIVAWNWKAGGTPVSNSNGSITSSVSAAPNAGFSIVSYTGTGANATVGHGLTQKPEWLVTKSRDSSLNWSFLQINDMTTDKVMALQATNAQFSSAGSFIESDFTATTFGVGTETPTNKSGDDFICYCFHSVEGYSKVGSYEGNSSSTDGPFVYTGFRPAWIIGKNADASGRWWIYDNKRTTFNDDGVENGRRLQANANTAESTSDSSNKVLFFSNGFKVNTSNSEWNTGNTYIYLAFAEQPFKFANSR
jgi:hypothetical protein